LEYLRPQREAFQVAHTNGKVSVNGSANGAAHTNGQVAAARVSEPV
jgi:hypothetical protein